MTTTLWIVMIILAAVVGMWVGYVFGCVAGHKDGVMVTKGGILFDAMEKIINAVNNDPLQCVSVCSKRRTPNRDTDVKLYKIGRKFYDEENKRNEVEQSNIESAESAKDGEAPDCEDDSCKLTFCGGDGNE